MWSVAGLLVDSMCSVVFAVLLYCIYVGVFVEPGNGYKSFQNTVVDAVVYNDGEAREGWSVAERDAGFKVLSGARVLLPSVDTVWLRTDRETVKFDVRKDSDPLSASLILEGV